MSARSPAATSLVAGIDSSTQSTKVELRELASGKLMATARAPHPSTAPPRSEQDPAAWWEAFCSCWNELGNPQVSALSVAGQQHGMVVLDERGEVVRPAKLWNDTESAPDAGWLIGQLGGAAAWVERTGSVPRAAFTATKLSWLHRSEPAAWQRLRRVLLPHDWMTLQLTGQFVTDRGDASGTGYWSPTEASYCADILAVIDRERDWSAAIPRVAEPLEAVGRWNGAIVACGTGDNMAAALGLGLEPGTAAVSIGTSGVVSTVSDRPVLDPSGAISGFADASGRFLPLVCTLNAGKVLDTVAALIGAQTAELADLGRRTDSSAGLTLLPYFDGERTPDLPGASGWLSGLRSGTTREQLARAALEAVACSLLDGLDALDAHVPVTRLVLTGGGARNSTLAGVIAALAGERRVVASSEQAEAVAAGACVQAAATLEGRPASEVAARWGLGATRRVDPLRIDGDVRQRYGALRDHAYPATGPA